MLKLGGASASLLLGSAPGFVQRITCNCGKTFVQRVGCRTGSDNRALWVKLAKMLNVPGIAHRSTIFGLEADGAGPRDSFTPGKGLPTSASTCCVSWPTERAEEQGRLPRGSWL